MYIRGDKIYYDIDKLFEKFSILSFTPPQNLSVQYINGIMYAVIQVNICDRGVCTIV